MARDRPSLTSTTPTAVASADVHIGHVQLRDLIVCPRERGVVAYVRHNAIAEQNLNRPQTSPRTLVELNFTPNTLASMVIPGTDHTLLAAGGQEAEIHLSCYSPPASRHSGSQVQWQFDDRIHGSINNSLLLTSLSMTQSNESSAEPRVAVSNNDGTVRFFDIPIRSAAFSSLPESGCVHLGMPINHSSISPDGRTLLSAGDSSKVFLHRLTGGSHINITPIATLSLPSPDISLLPYASNALVASFSSCFSSDGTKFAVASQEGVVAVWDVRSSKPLKTFHTDKTRVPLGQGGATGWLSDDPWDWTRGSHKAPGWSVRNVKFSQSCRNGMGKEIMMFTEHTSLLHVVDARTFETEEILHVPNAPLPSSSFIPVATPSHSRGFQRRPRPTLAHSEVATPPSATDPSSQMFMAALEDTFRVPSMAPTSRRRRLSRRSTPSYPGPTDEEDLLVIPPFGDRDIEHDVQTLLGRHGIRTRQASENERDRIELYTPDDRPDDMEVDELESDCLSSHTPSRSSSPSPSSHIDAGLGSRYSLSPPTRPIVRGPSPVPNDDVEDNLDIAGVCFDPSGRWIYVATTESVAEWSVKGADKMWWVDNDWA